MCNGRVTVAVRQMFYASVPATVGRRSGREEEPLSLDDGGDGLDGEMTSAEKRATSEKETFGS